jgi:anti-anti-sigma factor
MPNHVRTPIWKRAVPRRPEENAAAAEYSLLALIELSQALSFSLDPYRVADSLLLNLRGHFQLSRLCLWLLPDGGAPLHVYVRGYGISAEQAQEVMAACGLSLTERLRSRPVPVLASEVSGSSGAGRAHPLVRAGIQLFAPMCAGDEVLGIVALGPRGDDEDYTPLDLEALRASIAIAAVALQNARFHSRLFERNRELRAASVRLREVDRLKSEFLANVNHELRTPLAIIIASLDCMARAGETAAPGREFLDFASRQSKKLQDLIERVLTFSAASEGTLRPAVVAGDAAAFVDSYFRERLPGVASSLREFTCACEGAPFEAGFDPDHLGRILDALVDNAVKFTSAGARIQLRVQKVREDGDAWVRIDVMDDGPGIPPSQVPELFEAFQQGDGSMTRTVGGMGMGLALARRLAEGMGARLTVDTRPGAGSTFSLLLPANVQFAATIADEPVQRRPVMTNDLEIQPMQARGRTAVLRVKGRLDVKTAPMLLKQAGDIQTNGQDLVLNLAEVSFMGSSGVGALLVIAEQFHEQAGRVRFAAPSPAVANVIKLLNLDRFLQIDGTEEESLAALQD